MLSSMQLLNMADSSLTFSLLLLTGLVRPIVSIGFGPNPSVIASGMGAPIFVRMLRGGRTVLRDIYGDKIEEFKIAVSMVAINGKERIRPIFSNSKHFVKLNNEATVKMTHQKTNKRKNMFNVLAETLRIKRGSDGSN